MRNTLSLAAILVFAGAVAAQPMTLTTTFAAGNGQSGNLFDVDVVAPCILDSFNINVVAGTYNVEVYVCEPGGPGTGNASWVGNDLNAAAWNLIGTATGVTGLGVGIPTPLGLSLGYALLPGVTYGIAVVCSNGGILQYTNGTTVGSLFATDGFMNFYEGAGSAYPFAGTFMPRIFNGDILYTVAGGTPTYQVNQAGASLDINGVNTGGFTPASTSSVFCSSNTVTWSGSPTATVFDIGLTLGSALIPSFIPLGSQIVNLNIADPSFVFAFGGSFTTAFFPASVNFAFPSGFPSVQAQMVVFDSACPGGICLSQGIDHTTLAGAGSIALPGVDDGGTVIDIASSCWLADGMVDMYGVGYSQIVVESNGRVLMGNIVDGDFSATVAEAIGDAPSVGFWTDLSPNAGGTYTISSPAPGFINVNYAAVPIFGGGAPQSYDIDYTDATGEWSLNNLQGLAVTTAATDSFLGMSPGNGAATDPGAQPFGVGAAGAAGAPTDMLYEFSTGILQPASVAAGLNSILFSPDGGGNYVWLGL